MIDYDKRPHWTKEYLKKIEAEQEDLQFCIERIAGEVDEFEIGDEYITYSGSYQHCSSCSREYWSGRFPVDLIIGGYNTEEVEKYEAKIAEEKRLKEEAKARAGAEKEEIEKRLLFEQLKREYGEDRH